MKKTRKTVFLIIFVLLCGIFIFNQELIYEKFGLRKTEEDTQLNASIQQIVNNQRNSEKVIVKFEEITDFDWDTLYIFTPYTPISKIEETIKDKWRGDISIEYNDGFNLLVFVSKEKVVKYIKYPRDCGDFSSFVQNNVFTQEEAVFEGYGNKDWLLFEKLGE